MSYHKLFILAVKLVKLIHANYFYLTLLMLKLNDAVGYIKVGIFPK